MTNLEALIKAEIIPLKYSRLSPQDLEAIEKLTDDEVAAIISASNKLHADNPDFTRDHCGHGWLY